MSNTEALTLVPLGTSSLRVSRVGFGAWPIAGVSSLGVTAEASRATVWAALESGINFIDTAYAYGYDGEADAVLADVLRHWQGDPVVIASKVGTYLDAAKGRIVDGRPETLLEHTRQLLSRLGRDSVDVLYLHQPDPQVPLAESAGAIAEAIQLGLARYAGVSNVSAEQLVSFHKTCPVAVVQPPFNMLQPQTFDELRPLCDQLGIGTAVYWVLMKGLLAGKLPRDHQFDPRDKRLTYEVYQGDAWHRAQDLLDKLRSAAGDLNCTVSQLVVAWTLAQPGVTVALCGAKRPEQIEETAAAMRLTLSAQVLEDIDRWIGDASN